MRKRETLILGLLPLFMLAGLLVVLAPALAQDSGPSASVEAEAAVPTPEAVDPAPALEESAVGGLGRDEPLGRDIIYSVHRTPERLFDTPRSADVITVEEIRRRGARTLSDVLIEEPGFYLFQGNYGAGVPIIRGFLGKQVQILVDGVKLNNSVWRGTGLQYLNLVDINSVERIELVRGVVSVLGTESLGGAINIITEKNPARGRNLGGLISTRFSTADDAFGNSFQVGGQSARYRYAVGGSYHDFGEVEAGDEVGVQTPTGFDEGGGHVSFDYYPSPDRAISSSYRGYQQNDIPRFDQLFDGENLFAVYEPQRLQLATVSYEDLTDHKLFEFFKVTTFWNRQDQGEEFILADIPGFRSFTDDRQDQLGVNFELRSHAGGHRLIYGLDYTTEDISSDALDLELATGLLTPVRGRFTDDSSYDTLGLYLLDHVDLTNWLSLSVGARYGRFSASGSEDSSVGVLDLDSSDSDVTGSLSLVFHAARNLNLVANVMRGFRAPNIDNISTFNIRKDGVEVPNINISSETVVTYEAGAKYTSTKLSFSAFYHRSDLTDLLTRQPGTFKGLPFFDLDGDGVQDASEPAVLLEQNVGEAVIDGFEVYGRYVPLRSLVIEANYARVVGDDLTDNEPLRRIPPANGTLGVRLFSSSKRGPWIQALLEYSAAQRRLAKGDRKDSRIGPGGTDGYNVFHLRGGLSLMDRLSLNIALENVFDEAYNFHGSAVHRPGRQLVLGAQYGF